MKKINMDANSIRQQVQETVYRACLFKNEQKWKDWLGLCDEDFEYLITASVPEVRRDVIYLSGNKAEMESLVTMLPRHNSDRSQLRRHAVVYDVVVDEESGTAEASTSVTIYQTHWDGSLSHINSGSTELYAAGSYKDTFRLNEDSVKFVRRELKLDTRNLQKGCHFPL